MAAAYRAGAARLPFGMLRGYIGTDLAKHNPRIQSVACPYTGEEIATVPAVNPDVTILHAQRADRHGNVAIDGIVGAAREAALAASKLLVTVEKIVDELPPAMNNIVLPHFTVTAVSHCPGGAWPSYAQATTRATTTSTCVGRDRARPRSSSRPGSTAHVRGSRRDRRARSLRAAAAGEKPRCSRSDYTRDEMMTVAAARLLKDGQVCFVGIGLPSAACNLARLTHAPNLVLIYESGTIGTRPTVLPLSIGDGELAETATCVIPLPDIFSDYLQAGRIDVGFLGAAQIDKYGNLNSTVIGPYDKPKTRLPGAGGATEIAAHARQVFIVMKATPRSFVKALDFQTSGGHFAGRSQSGARGSGPAVIVTDVGILKPHPESGEFALSALYPGIPADEATAAVGWPLAVLPELETCAAPTAPELEALRALEARTAAAHREPVRLPL